jgi:hypothetical protein
MALVLALLGAGCAQQSSGSCDIVQQLANDLFDAKSVVHCEDFLSQPDAGADAWQRAQDCVIQAVQKDRVPFSFYFTDPRSSAHLRGGYDGVPLDSGRMSVRSYAYVGDTSGAPGDAHPQLSVRTCDERPPAFALERTPGCTPSPGVPCLDCVNPAGGSLLCAGR